MGPILWTAFVAFVMALIVAFIVEGGLDVPLSEGSFRFERPWAALLLMGALLAFAARGYVQRGAAPRIRLSRGAEIARAAPTYRIALLHLPTGLRTVALTLLAIALMGPQSIHARNRAELDGIDIVMAIDLSLSMEAADIRPNRFEATKEVVDDFIARRPNDRMGAVVFGRDAYTLLPLTTDKDSLRGAIRGLQLRMIDGQGTAIGNALGVSLNRLRDSRAESKVVILLSDGDSNAGNVSPEQAAELAATMHVKVFTILMGQSNEAPMPQGVDIFGRQLFGQQVMPVNPELLRHVAERTGGTAYHVADREQLESSFHGILDTLERSEIEDAGKVYGDLYGAFLWPALLALLAEMVIAGWLLRRWP
jgi:Ca-activated chloride channel family protein